MKYASGAAFRRALEARLRATSLETGVPLVRLRKMVAFDRFLVRLFSYELDQWVVKGGFVLQLRLGNSARTTKDIDLLSRSAVPEIYPHLRKTGAINLGDWFVFEVLDTALSNFDAVWTAKNTGTATWDSNEVDYRYDSGDKIHQNEIYDLPNTVKPGESINLVVDMQAPDDEGKYDTTWVLHRGGLLICTMQIEIKVEK